MGPCAPADDPSAVVRHAAAAPQPNRVAVARSGHALVRTRSTLYPKLGLPAAPPSPSAACPSDPSSSRTSTRPGRERARSRISLEGRGSLRAYHTLTDQPRGTARDRLAHLGL